MNGVNKTLYIPLYGKSYVSKKKFILHDAKAEEIWEKEQFALKRKSRSKWLAYFMAMRARVFDEWVKTNICDRDDLLILHIGCGMDSRYLRVNEKADHWYDIDFPDVIAERKRYYEENAHYKMLEGDASKPTWIKDLPEAKNVLVLLEGISMYLTLVEVQELLFEITKKYENASVLMDVYTSLGAKASKYKNPINDVGVALVYGIDEPTAAIKENCIDFTQELDMAPMKLINELQGFERWFFKTMFGGKIAKSMYRLFEYRTGNKII